jgi:hypothetical protein
MSGLTAERLRELLHYNPDTGAFTRLKRCVVGRRSGGGKAGDRLGSQDDQGYLRIMVERVRYKAHRLAVLYVTGKWPAGEVDHINGARADNRWSNLRDVSKPHNLQNRSAANSNSSTGLLGVHAQYSGGTCVWVAVINANRSRHYLGRFASPEDAHAAYLNAKRTLHVVSPLGSAR